MNFNKNPIYWFSAGTIIRQLVSFIMLPIYTNYLTPSDYGVVVLLLLIMSLYELFLGAQFGRAVPKFFYAQSNDSDKDAVVITALSITVCISSFGLAAFYFSSPLISNSLLDSPNLVGIISLYSVMMVSSTIESYVLILFRLKKRPDYFFFISIAKLAVQLSLNILAVVYLEMGVSGVLYSTILSSILFAGVSLLYVVKTCELKLNYSVIKPIFYFTWPLWLAGIADVYINFFSKYSIKEFISIADVGIYFLAEKFGLIISMLIWQPFAQWWNTTRFEIIQVPKEMYRIPLIFDLTSYILVVCGTGISILAPVILKMMVSEPFYSAFGVMFIIVFNRIAIHFGQFFTLSILHSGETKIITRLSILKATLITVLLIPMAINFGIYGVAVTFLAISLLIFGITVFISKRKLDLGVNLKKSVSFAIISFGFSFYASINISLARPVGEIFTDCLILATVYLIFVAFVYLIDVKARNFFLSLFLKRSSLSRG